MPLAVFVPAGLNDLAADVNVGATPAQGAVFYKSATFWTALPPDTDGKVLTTHGPGVDPTWETPSGGGGAFVSLAPALSTTNVIEATADAADLTLKPFSDAQASPVLLQQNAAGSADLVYSRPNGDLFANRLIGLAGTTAEQYEAFSADWGDSFDAIVTITPTGGNMDFVGLQVDGASRAGGFLQYFTLNAAAPVGSRVGLIADIIGLALVDDTGALSGQDLQIRVNGSSVTLMDFQPDKVSFFGVDPVVRQANASAAGVSGIAAGAAYAQADMVAVKAALTVIRASLAANGLLAATA
jgi:hypothetical protein